MPDSPETCVIVCESVHAVMALERALKDAGIRVEMIPTPRALTSDCGMALEISTADTGLLAGIREERHVAWLGVYRRQDGAYHPLGNP